MSVHNVETTKSLGYVELGDPVAAPINETNEKVKATAEENIAKFKETFGAKEQETLKGRIGKLNFVKNVCVVLIVALVIAGLAFLLWPLSSAAGIAAAVFVVVVYGGLDIAIIGVLAHCMAKTREENLKAIQYFNPNEGKMQGMIRQLTKEQDGVVLNVSKDTKDDWYQLLTLLSQIRLKQQEKNALQRVHLEIRKQRRACCEPSEKKILIKEESYALKKLRKKEAEIKETQTKYDRFQSENALADGLNTQQLKIQLGKMC